MATELKTTNYVVSTSADIEDGTYLDELWLLGWDSNTDWFTEIDAQDIITPKGNVKKCQYGFMIQVNRHESVYVGHEQKNCQSYCDDAIKEGYECCVCRIEKDANGDLVIYKV